MGTPRGTTTSTITGTTTEHGGFGQPLIAGGASARCTGQCHGVLAIATVLFMVPSAPVPPADRTQKHRRPLGQRIALISLSVVVAFVVPMVVATTISGPVAAFATLMGVIGGFSGSMRSGWSRTIRVIPFMGVLGATAAFAGYGWGWVMVMGAVGLVAGCGYPYGYLAALVYAGFVPTMVHSATSGRNAILIGCFAIAGGIIGVTFAHRLGAARVTPAPPRRPGGVVLPAIVGLCLLGGGAAIAIATSLPHGYWIPLTLIAIVPPLTMGDTGRGRQRLTGTVGALLIVIPVSLIPLPIWTFYVLGFLLFIPAFAVYRRSYGYYAFFESAAVVMLVSAGHNVLETGEARAAAAAIAIALLVVTVAVVTWILKRLPEARAPAPLIDA